MSGFGYLLYNDRILLIFGGKVYDERPADNIYFLDILDSNSSWKEAKIKCPLKGGYHAILEKDPLESHNDKVHLFSASPMKEHFVIHISDLLETKILSLSKPSSSRPNNKAFRKALHGPMKEKSNMKSQYNAIWIDKSKLSAKSRIECTPFYMDCRSTIIYSAEYNLYDENQGGIYAYDNILDKHTLIEKFEAHQYYPSGHTCIYNAPTEEIIFIGGKNVKNNRKPYEIMMIYDMNDHSMTKVLFKRAIGSDPKLLLIDENLHIVGGSHNTYHLCYNTSSNELKPIYPFPYSNGLSGHGLLHCEHTNSIITFGGAYYDYISCSYQFCNDYWVYNMQNHQYQCIYNKTLPQTANGFGYVLFAKRIIITFGGSIQRNKFIDNIYWTDILNPNEGWKEAQIKCPKKGGYHALLIENKIVHLIHFGKEQFCMNIHDLLPLNVLNALNNVNIDQSHQLNAHYHHNHHNSSNVLRAAQSVQQMNQTSDLKQLLMEYTNQIQQLQSDNHRLKIDNAMFKTQLFEFEQDRAQKEFIIANLQKDNEMLRNNISFDLNMNADNFLFSAEEQNLHLMSLLPSGSSYKHWSYTEMLDWIINLENGRFKCYYDELNRSMHQVVASGNDLQHLTEDALESFASWQFDDKSALFKRIRLLVSDD